MDEIRQRWVRPVNAHDGMVIELVIQLIPTGEIVQVEVGYRDATATDAFVTSVVKAIGKVRRFDKLSQLNPELFDANFRKFTVKFKPEDL
jgi:colicin import membrane protein